jgi:hypothetical protein
MNDICFWENANGGIGLKRKTYLIGCRGQIMWYSMTSVQPHQDAACYDYCQYRGCAISDINANFLLSESMYVPLC